MVSRYEQQMDLLRREATEVERALQDKVARTKDKKRRLKTEKNQLLDFVEENVQKQQVEEAHKQRLLQQIGEAETRIKDMREERELLWKEKENLDDLIKQT